MRSRALVSVIAVLAATAAIAEDSPAPKPAAPPSVVYLYGLNAMEQLKAANPDHYSRAERIIAAADELCKPGPEQVYYARFEAKEISCEAMMLKTSNPPKRQIGFTLDEIRYVALVTMTDTDARFIKVPGETLPADPRIHPKDAQRLVPPVQPVEPGK
jgi:hypothetical protein